MKTFEKVQDKKVLHFITIFLTVSLFLFVLAVPCLSAESPPSLDHCVDLFDFLEQSVDAAGIRNVSTFRVPGYPFFRTNRFLEEIRYFVADQEERDQWLDLLAQQGKQAMQNEIDNLPDEEIKKLLSMLQAERGESGREFLKTMALKCGETLLAREKRRRGFSGFSLRTVEIPSEYRKIRKVFGLYPLFTLPVGTAIANYKAKVKREFAKPLEQKKGKGALRVLSPETLPFPGLKDLTTEVLLDESFENPLNIPILSKEELEWVVHEYAPILEQDVTGEYDLPGTIEWQEGRIGVDTMRPSVYYYATYMLFSGRPLLQLNYVLWYTERPGISLIDIEAGRIHGMTIRITLHMNGEPIMVDTIHNCGCYHFFFPSKKVYSGLKTRLFREDAFVPQWLPSLQDASRLAVRIGSKRHWVERLHYRNGKVPAHAAYKLLPYDLLESLPGASGDNKSIFDAKGIVRGGTERPERFFLFSIGIPEIGSMRQRGHHVTALIGERAFDDPRLFEKFFLR